MQRHVFEAMGTTVDCLLEAEPDAGSATRLRAVEAEFERLQAIFSRFLPDSELSALNREGSLEAGPDLLRVTLLALEARRTSGGRFDPTVHEALVAAGYDRSFDDLAPHAGSAVASAPRCGGRIRVDAGTGLIELGAGVRLDLGGIAKGDAVDRACDLLAPAGPCLVNAGGDLAVRGRPVRGSWPIGLDTPDGVLTIRLAHGGMATSGRDRRRWCRDGHEQHHLIDPRTGRPSESDIRHVTAVGATAAEAEVLAKTLFLAGTATAIAEAEEREIPAVVVTEDGQTLLAGGIA